MTYISGNGIHRTGTNLHLLSLQSTERVRDLPAATTELDVRTRRQPQNIAVAEQHPSSTSANLRSVPEGAVSGHILSVHQRSHFLRIVVVVDDGVDPHVLVGNDGVVDHVLTGNVSVSHSVQLEYSKPGIIPLSPITTDIDLFTIVDMERVGHGPAVGIPLEQGPDRRIIGS